MRVAPASPAQAAKIRAHASGNKTVVATKRARRTPLPPASTADQQLMQQVKESGTLERANNASGYKHVYVEGKKYKGMLKERGRLLDLGLFDLPRLAAAAEAEFKKTRDGGMVRGSGLSRNRRRAAVSEAVAREVAACQNWQCAGSDCPLPDERGNLPAEFEIDHINGDASNSVITNLQALCGICHNKKSSRERQQRLQAAAATRK